ncbi:MAG: dihydroneopterin aldolase [Bacillota bacterium]|nr:dihydroneopterin aldolase [Bacillota bacterium]
MDKIIMKNMRFYGYHGVLPEEREDGQNFEIDVELYLDLKKAGISDELKDSVDYSQVYGIIKEITESNKFRLVEKLGESISREILSRFKEVERITVCVKKPEAPIDGEFGWVGIEITRSRNV